MRRMRGDDRQPDSMFSDVSAEPRVPKDHPLRAIRAVVDDVLREMSREFDGLYATVGRPSIPPERLLRAQLLQIDSIRSEVVSGHVTCGDDARQVRLVRTPTTAAGALTSSLVCLSSSAKRSAGP